MPEESLDGLVSREVTRRKLLTDFIVGLIGYGLGSFAPQLGDDNVEAAQHRGRILEARAPYSLDRQFELPSNRTRPRRSTDYILLHTTEAEFSSSINTLTKRAKAHYLIDRDGTVYSIVNRDRWANHAGKSMWEGKENLSDFSVGIENIGYHYAPLSEKQYKSLKVLIGELKRIYRISDKNILGHFQVAYDQNRWTNGRRARGRKKDGINIDWDRLGLNHRTDDPDVQAGRVNQDPFLVSVLEREERGKGLVPGIREDPVLRVRNVYGSNTVNGNRTAWTIAGDEYDQPTTFYVFPNDKIATGDQITDWAKIPRGTRVFTNTNLATVVRNVRPIIILKEGETVWSNVQAAYNNKETCYVLPNSKDVTKGDEADFNKIIPGTRIVLPCTGPFKIDASRTPFKIAGKEYNTDNSVYILPNGEMKTGKQIENFRGLPKDTSLLLRKL